MMVQDRHNMDNEEMETKRKLNEIFEKWRKGEVKRG